MPISRRRRAHLRRIREQRGKKPKRDTTEIIDLEVDDEDTRAQNTADSGWEVLDGDSESTQVDSSLLVASTKVAVLRWNENGEGQLRGLWGKGSRSMEKRKRRNAREFDQQAAGCLKIDGMFKRVREKAEGQLAAEGCTEEASVDKANEQDPQGGCRNDCTRLCKIEETVRIEQSDKT